MATSPLLMQLSKHAWPSFVTLPTGRPSPEAGRLLLVDVASLEAWLLARRPASPAAAHASACALIARLSATGLQLVFVAGPEGGSACTGDAAACGAARAAALARTPPSPACRWAVLQAVRDAPGCQLLVAAGSAHRLLLAHGRRHAPNLFALLTDSPDLFASGAASGPCARAHASVLTRANSCPSVCHHVSLPLPQVERIALLSDTIADAAGVTFAVWSCDAAWHAWRRSVQRGARPPSAEQRACVASLLAGAARTPSPALAAAMALATAPEERLGLPFFTQAACCPGFGAKQLADFRAAVELALSEAEEAGRGGWQRHAVMLGIDGDGDDIEAEGGDDDDERPLPWLPRPALRPLLALLPCPAAAAAARGVVVLGGRPGEAGATAGAARAAALAALLGPPPASAAAAAAAGRLPGDVYEYDAAAHSLRKVAWPPAAADPAGGADAPPPGWFVPASLARPVAPARLPPAAAWPPAAAPPWPDAGGGVAGVAAGLVALSADDGGAAPAAAPLPVDDAALLAAQLLAFGALPPAAPPPAPAAVVSQLRAALRLGADFAAAAVAGAPLLDAPAPSAASEAAAAAPGGGGPTGGAGGGPTDRPLVDVGSGLSKADWRDLDDKELVARTRAGGSFRTLQAIKPWSADAHAAQPLARDAAFEYAFLLRRESGTLWRRLLDACFPAEAAAATSDKARKKALSARTPAAVLEELRSRARAGGGPAAAAAVPGGPATAAWLEALGRGEAADQLALRRSALRAGPAAPEWAAARLAWAAAPPRVRAAAAELQHSGAANKGGALGGGGAPVRYKHQEQLLALVDAHLTASSGRGGAVAAGVPPLRAILSTPTGSGKTFTALLLSLQLLQPKHPGYILVYSVPTKQVLKRVGQECEAHAAVYWTAARDGDQFQVRRPYSVRTKRDKGGPTGAKGGSGSGTMAAQLEEQRSRAAEGNDRGGGTPSIIVADVYAAAALCEAAALQPRSSPFHASRLVLARPGGGSG